MRREFPRRLHHEVPSWVEDGALFHIRIALERGLKQNPLTYPPLARAILNLASLYQQKERWHITVFLLMPDHLHALLSFPPNESMSSVISDWKRFHARKHQVAWQEGYFDHRLRDDERGKQLSMKIDYIRENSVAARLCERSQDWPWIIEPLE
jgi:putative transposase